MKILSAVFELGVTNMAQVPCAGMPQIAFLGRSNVGKSSLLNTLMGEKKLVKVSATPGKTRELNFFRVNEAFYFVDLPGVGYAKVGIKERDRMAERIKHYVEKAEDLRGIVYLVDLRHGGTPMDIATVDILRALGRPVLVVGSKRDKLNQSEFAKSLRLVQERFGLDAPPLAVSSFKKTGIDQLWSALTEILVV
jgi:GTP-binding protein